MNTEIAVFLQILADHLHKRPTIVDNIVDWERILLYAEKHQVEGIVYHQCSKMLPEVLREGMKKKYIASVYFFANRNKLFSDIARSFSAAKIPFYTVKGLNIAKYYPVPELRTMGDCDIVVPTEYKEICHELMLSLGFTNQYKQKKEWTYFKNGMEFEIHDHLLYDEAANSEKCRVFADNAWEYLTPQEKDNCFELDWNYHFVFMLLHIKKHIMNSGVGFRQFMDLTVIASRFDLNWQWIKETLKALDLLEFGSICCAFCQRWFDVELPFPINDMGFYEEGTMLVLENGVFGFNNKSNADNFILTRIDVLGKKKTILSSLFPSYHNMRLVPYYSFVNRKPWLLPVAWIYRFIRCFRYGKSAEGVKQIGTVITADEKMVRRKAILQKWGL